MLKSRELEMRAFLETCDIVVDVGGVHDPSKHRYDHHQRYAYLCHTQWKNNNNMNMQSLSSSYLPFSLAQHQIFEAQIFHVSAFN